MTDAMAKQIRRVTLDQSKQANVGRIGSSLSVADVITALYDGALRVRDLKDPERDHLALAVTVKGYYPSFQTGQQEFRDGKR